MRDGSRRSAAAHQLADIATGEADIAEQVVVELEQVNVGVPARRALEKGREQAHFLGILGGFLASPPGMERLMIDPR